MRKYEQNLKPSGFIWKFVTCFDRLHLFRELVLKWFKNCARFWMNQLNTFCLGLQNIFLKIMASYVRYQNFNLSSLLVFQKVIFLFEIFCIIRKYKNHKRPLTISVFFGNHKRNVNIFQGFFKDLFLKSCLTFSCIW